MGETVVGEAMIPSSASLSHDAIPRLGGASKICETQVRARCGLSGVRPIVTDSPDISSTRINCLGCGFDLSGTAIVAPCPECGRPVSESLLMGHAAMAHPLIDPARGMATAAFATALGALFIVPPLSVVGSVLGWFALRRYRHEGGSTSTMVLAHCGIWIGLLGVLLSVGVLWLIML